MRPIGIRQSGSRRLLEEAEIGGSADRLKAQLAGNPSLPDHRNPKRSQLRISEEAPLVSLSGVRPWIGGQFRSNGPEGLEWAVTLRKP